jgi:hypothetical protein
VLKYVGWSGVTVNPASGIGGPRLDIVDMSNTAVEDEVDGEVACIEIRVLEKFADDCQFSTVKIDEFGHMPPNTYSSALPLSVLEKAMPEAR